MGFKKILTQAAKPTDPESLFRDLPVTSPEIKSLWSQQADILREYTQKHLKSKDIAIELPTGTGKTLVGLLIGEFRRRAYDERVVYLCPTRQLAYQVQKQASKYGINSHVFVPTPSGYSIPDYNEYLSGKAIGITTYSGLFNINPKLKDANVIILDDAHAGENYIVSLWSVEINRYNDKELFFKIISLFEDRLSNILVESLREEGDAHFRKDSVDMIPAPTLWERLESIRTLINENMRES
ncbi:MAG TPA: DEAD/DEAH box helicase [Candidatus Methylomirabilis sp.]|nr:DEAD/DEAH box helicase [Candidatus Methylomirabilis sp.]